MKRITWYHWYTLKTPIRKLRSHPATKLKRGTQSRLRANLLALGPCWLQAEGTCIPICVSRQSKMPKYKPTHHYRVCWAIDPASQFSSAWLIACLNLFLCAGESVAQGINLLWAHNFVFKFFKWKLAIEGFFLQHRDARPLPQGPDFTRT